MVLTSQSKLPQAEWKTSVRNQCSTKIKSFLFEIPDPNTTRTSIKFASFSQSILSSYFGTLHFWIFALFDFELFGMNDITQRCSQPWLGGILGGPVVPAHQPRQIIDGNQTQRPTVSTSWNRGFVWRSASLATNLFPGGIWIHISFLSKQTCLMQPRFLFTCFDILQVEENACFRKFYWLWKKRRMYTALPVPSEKSTSHMCPITKLLLFKCHATFILPKWLRGNSELFSYIPLNVKFLSLRKI